MKKCILTWLCLTAISLNGLAYQLLFPNAGVKYLIANQRNEGNNSLVDVFGNQLPDLTSVLIWQCCDAYPTNFSTLTGCYHTYYYDTTDPVGLGTDVVWYEGDDFTPIPDPNAVFLAPGQGAFVIPGSAPLTLTFNGTHNVPVWPVNLPCHCGHWNLLSRQTDDTGTYENIAGRAPADGAQVLRWNVASQNFTTYTFSDCTWTPSEPSLDIGESAFFLIPCVTNCCCVPPNMSAWWPFDETSGPPANDIAGTVNNFGIYGSSPTPVAGMVSNALCFNGTTDFVLVTNQAEINFNGSCTSNNAESFTIDAWIRASTNGPGTQTLLDKRVNPGSPQGYSVFLFNGILGIQIGDGVGWQNYYGTTPDLRDGLWHFIAVTVARCTNDVNAGTLYVDGNVVYTFTDPSTGDLNNSANLYISCRNPAFGTNYYSGCLDELEIYKRALTTREIEKIFYAGSAGKCKTNCNCNCPTNLSYTVTISNCCTLIANQLDKPGGNTLANIMPSLPCNSRFMKYDNAGSTWITTTYSTATGWADGSITLNPGEGAFLCPCCCTNGYTLTFTGCPHVPVLPVNVPDMACYLLSRQTNAVGTYENIVGETPESGAIVWKWTCGGYVCFVYIDVDIWLDCTTGDQVPAPTAAVGEALWVSPWGVGGAQPPPEIPCPTNYVSGVKFNDLNTNGVWDVGEPGVGDWVVSVYDEANNLIASTVTDSNGHYSFSLPCGTYTLTESNVTGWFQTYPANGYYVVTVGSGPLTNLNFGNSTNCIQLNCTNVVRCSLTNVVLDTLPATAVDLCRGGSVPVTSDPSFPHPFEVGTTWVTCWAGGATRSFSVTVTRGDLQTLALYNTGVDGNSNPLNGGDTDTHYKLGVNPDGETHFVVVYPDATVMGAWLPDSGISRWISPRSDGNGYVGTTAYVYEVKFPLFCTNNAIITGRWAADNSGCILLNSNSIADPGGQLFDETWSNFAEWHPFTITSGFVEGDNTLDFCVTNSSDYTGLRVELSGSACCCTNTTGQVSITNVSWNQNLNQMTFSWPTSPVAWYLQGTTNLITGPWITLENFQLNICNAWNIVDIPIVPTNNMFFRLVHTNTP
jgi:hypothetical protein